MFIGPVKFLDDRGQRVRLIEFGAPAAKEDPDLAVALARIADRVHETPSTFAALVLAGAIPVGAFVGAIVLAVFVPGFPGWVIWLAGLMGLVPAWFVLLHRKRRRYMGHIVSSLLRIARCPCCGYNFRGTNPGEDGKYLCPECSAAWDKSRVTFGAMRQGELAYSGALTGAHTPVHLWLRSWLVYAKMRDDRDRVVSVLPPTLPGIEKEVGEQAAETMRDELRRRTESARGGWTVFIVLLGIVLVGSQVWAMTHSNRGTLSISSAILAAILLVLHVGGAWRAWTGRSGTTSWKTLDYLRGRGICPSCGAGLGEVAVEKDGCAVCPCCACAWVMKKEMTPRGSIGG